MGTALVTSFTLGGRRHATSLNSIFLTNIICFEAAARAGFLEQNTPSHHHLYTFYKLIDAHGRHYITRQEIGSDRKHARVQDSSTARSRQHGARRGSSKARRHTPSMARHGHGHCRPAPAKARRVRASCQTAPGMGSSSTARCGHHGARRALDRRRGME